jgi:MFS family permease
MGIDALEANGTVAQGEGWRWMFVIGAVPALLIILTKKYLREPEGWLRLKAAGQLPKGNIFSPYVSLIGARRWRKNLIIGALIASTGVVGLWAIGEYAVDLQRNVFASHFAKSAPANLTQAVSEADARLKSATGPEVVAAKESLEKAKAALGKEVKPHVDQAISTAYLLNMLGAAVGMWLFTHFASAFGRRPAFMIGFTISLLVTAFVYWKMETPQDANWMMPLMGAAQLGPFAGFAIYLPELFPGSLRSTGTSFCYNLGRFAAAGGSFYSSVLTVDVFGHHPSPLPLRYSAMAMCAIFFVGIITAIFAPETKGQPLPEDELPK